MNNAKHLFLGLLTAISFNAINKANDCGRSGDCGRSRSGCSNSFSSNCCFNNNFTGNNTGTNFNHCGNSCSESFSGCDRRSNSCGRSSNCGVGRVDDRRGRRGNNCTRQGFAVRPLSTDNTLELALWNYYVYHHDVEMAEECPVVDLQVNYFHRQSTRRHRGAGLFHNGRNSILVAQDGTGDINSLWLNLASPVGNGFRSRLTIHPRHRVDGAYVGARFNLDDWMCGMWASVSFAVARVKNRLEICEQVITPGTICNLRSVTEAIASQTGGRFNPCNRGRTHVDDIQFKLGYDYYFGCDEDSHLGLYFVGTAPTRRRHHHDLCDTNSFWDGRLGSHHGSVGIGLNTDLTLWACDDSSFNWMADLKYRYVLRARETRVFDLNRRPLSRFLQVVTADQPLDPRPALPFLTREVCVTPRSTIDFWTALHYQACAFGAEFGYDLYWKQKEKVCLKGRDCCNPLANQVVGIFDIANVGAGATTASTANITQGATGPNAAVGDAVFTPITNRDLSLASARHCRVLSHKVYGALSYTGDWCCMPSMVGIGAEYEFVRRCDPALRHWGVFVKAAVSF